MKHVVSARVKFIAITIDELFLVPVVIFLAYFFLPDLLIPITLVVIIGAIIFVAIKYYLAYPVLKQSFSHVEYEMVGMKAYVIEEVTATSGKIRVGSELWDARSKTGEVIPKGSEVVIVSLSGMKLIVTHSDD